VTPTGGKERIKQLPWGKSRLNLHPGKNKAGFLLHTYKNRDSRCISALNVKYVFCDRGVAEGLLKSKRH
jgi:hypothetical protein